MARVAVIGLGNIGGGVARNLCRADMELTVFDVAAARTNELAAMGATVATSAGAAASHADVVFTSLPGPAQVASVGDEIVAAMAPGSIWVELSTNDLAIAHRMDALARVRGVRCIDAPVSGGPEGAEAGSLSIYVGGEPAVVEAVMPLLEIIGDRVDHLGPRGAGIVAKIAQVTLCYTQTVALTEALLLGVRGGVEPAEMLDLIRHSAGRSYVADVYGPEILAGTYDASFPIGHAAKDMRLAMELADSVAVDLPFMARVADHYARAEETYGSADPHLRAAHLLEAQNDLVFHEMENAAARPGTRSPTSAERTREPT